LEKRLRKKVGQAIHDFRMIRRGDRVLVAVSGGKDSIVLMKILLALKEAAPLVFELIPVHVKTGYDIGFERVSAWILENLGYETIIRNGYIDQIMETVSDPEKSPCALCSRLRRGILYSLAEEMGATSIALGHHLDDIIETYLLRGFYTGQLGAMAPERTTDDGRNRIIRPLAYCTSDLIEGYFTHLEVEPVAIQCPIRRDSKRELIRGYLKMMENDIPTIKHSLFAALGNIDMKSLCIKATNDAHRD